MGQVLEEDPDMRAEALTHEFLVHVGLPRQALHVLVLADADEALAALVARIPEVLHHPEDPEDAAMSLHETAARRAERPHVAGAKRLHRGLGGKAAAVH